MMMPLLLLLGIALMIPSSDPSVLYHAQQCWIRFRDNHGRRLLWRCPACIADATTGIRKASVVARIVNLLTAVSSLAVAVARTAAAPAPASRCAPNNHAAGCVCLPHAERICGKALMLRKRQNLAPRGFYSRSKHGLEGNLPMQQVFTQPRASQSIRSVVGSQPSASSSERCR